MKIVKLMSLGLAAGAMLGARAELLRFTPQLTNNEQPNGQYLWGSAQNWLTESGANKAPAEGDDLLVDVSTPHNNFQAANMNVFVNSIRFTQKSSSYAGISYGGFRIKSGGDGLVVEHTSYKAAYSTLFLDGDVTIDLNGDMWWQGGIEGRSASSPGRFTKLGPAVLDVETAKNYWTGGTIREGIVRLRSSNDKSGIDFHFDCIDSAAASATLQLVGDIMLKDGAITSSEGLTHANHTITSRDATACSLSITGTPKVQHMYFDGAFTGPVSFTFAPSSEGCSFTLARGVSVMTGGIVVSNAAFNVTSGAVLTGLSSLTVDGGVFSVDATSLCNFASTQVALVNGGSLAIASGVRLRIDGLTIDGEPVATGVYKSVTGGEDGATGVAWIDGDGVVQVGSVAEPETAVDAVWTKVGDGDVSVAANWQGNVAPQLDGAQTKAVVAADVAGDVRINIDRDDVWLKGIEAAAAQNVTVTAAEGKKLMLGSGGIATPAGKSFTIDAETELMSSQEWNVRGAAGSLTVDKAIASLPGNTLTVNGEGSVTFAAASPMLWAELVVSNVQAVVSGVDSLGPKGAPPVLFHHYQKEKTPQFSDGAVINRDMVFVDSSKAKEGASEITLPANAEVTFNGFVSATNQSSLDITREAGATVTFNNLFKALNACRVNGSGTTVFNGPFYCQDRFYMNGGVVEFHDANGKNRLYGNYGAFKGGRIKTMAVNTLNNAAMNVKGSGVLDLCGNDQVVNQVAMHAGGGTVTSETPAKLRIVRNYGFWPNHNYAYGCEYTVPSGYSKDDGYGYECVDRGYWTGAVTLSYEAQSPSVRFMARASTSTGNVEVVSGRMVFMRRAAAAGETFDLKLGSANPCPRETSHDGSWTNMTALVVKGGEVVFEHSNVIGRNTNVQFEQKGDGTYGKLCLEVGVVQKCNEFYVDGVRMARGTWGAAGSGAKHVDDVRFAGSGILNVIGDGMGMAIIIR